MGIKFGDLLNEIREPLKLRELKGKKVGIDAYVVIYQMLARIRSDDNSANALTDSQGRTTSHLQGLSLFSLPGNPYLWPQVIPQNFLKLMS